MRAFGRMHATDYSGKLTPDAIIDAVSRVMPKDTPIVTDVGQHQMWVAQRYPFAQPRTFLTSGGLGTMGFGMGAANGACIGTGRKTVLFTGDGSFAMNFNELGTAVTEGLPVIVVLMDNGVLGWYGSCRGFQQRALFSDDNKQKNGLRCICKGNGGRGIPCDNNGRNGGCHAEGEGGKRACCDCMRD